MNFNKKIAVFTLSLLTSGAAMAGGVTSVMTTAPVKAPGQYEMKLQTDVIFNGGGGVNISPHLVTGLVDHFFDIDAFFGTGKTGFMVGATTKYNLLPDLPEQMGLSFLGGISLIKDKPRGREDDLTRGVLSLGVLASKELQADFGTISPYAAFQPEFTFRSDYSEFLMSLALGAHWKVTDTAPWGFYSEFGISLRHSHYMLAVGASYPF
jgi:hypothetical protein